MRPNSVVTIGLYPKRKLEAATATATCRGGHEGAGDKEAASEQTRAIHVFIHGQICEQESKSGNARHE